MSNKDMTVREYAAQSEEHARKALEMYRHHLMKSRFAIEVYENEAQGALYVINEVKRVMYEKGWTEK